MTVQDLIDILTKHAKDSPTTQSLQIGITINDHFYEFSNISQEYINQENDITFFSIDKKRTTTITKVLCFNKLIDNAKQTKPKKNKTKKQNKKDNPDQEVENIDDDNYVEF